ncbi:MAG: histidine ammonia-lyase [Saprospiraceae bacterium]|nr:histidine ammonia-lyase [Saprospiraceae bacterium]
MQQKHTLTLEPYKIQDIQNLINSYNQIELGDDAISAIVKCHDYLSKKLEKGDEAFYGINTGFGSLCNVVIGKDQLKDLQTNLVLSHSCGTGDVVPPEVVKIILLLKIRSLSYGFSGISSEVINRLLFFYNHNILPVIFQQGSLGASGDLAPLAHLSLPLLGEGLVWYNDKRVSSKDVLSKYQLRALELGAKEGLALLNGTQFSTGYGVYAIIEAQKIMKWANCIGALSAETFLCSDAPWDEKLHKIRRQPGQIHVAKEIRNWLHGSLLLQSERVAIQDPYAFRCMPQVHGATFDTIEHVKGIIENEINAVTDNPNIFVNEDQILSGGNFHAQPIALVLDFLAIALSELGSISERRTYQLIAGLRNLPPFLTKNPGLNSGFMIPQYTAASIVSQNKQLCTPASVDSIVSSNGQEDHVSMAANSATKLYRVVQNMWTILAIEWLNACQALEFRRPLRTSDQLEALHQLFRQKVSAIDVDRQLSIDIHAARDFLQEQHHLA